jgi:hypothetical protein
MDKFREAIRARKYKFAAVYVTKDYADELERVNTNAAELGEVIDKIRNWGDNKGILSDKSKIALYQVDPFPPTFKVGAAPKIEGNKAYSFYIWEVPKLDNPATNILLDVKSTMDYKMFVHILSRPAFGPKTELIKEGEEWKINIPMTPEWQAEIGYFNDHAKTYSTALTSFWNDINRDRFESKAKFESELFSQLRASK